MSRSLVLALLFALAGCEAPPGAAQTEMLGSASVTGSTSTLNTGASTGTSTASVASANPSAGSAAPSSSSAGSGVAGSGVASSGGSLPSAQISATPTASVSAPGTSAGSTSSAPSADASAVNTALDASSPPQPSASNTTAACTPFSGERPAPLALSGNTFAHDPTLLVANGTFFRFWTGEFVPSARSTDLRSWSNASPVYPNAYPQWVTDWKAMSPDNTFNFPWAPDASYFGGRYHLYASFSAYFGRNTSCITHLTSADPAQGNWTDHGPVLCSTGNDDYNAIDPDVGLDADGNAWLAFGSFWDGIFAFPLDADGNRVGNTVTHLAWAPEIEAPVLFQRCGYYYLLVSWGLCCPGEGRSVDQLTYRIAVGRSENILGPYLDKTGTPLTDGGGTLLVEGDHVKYAAAGHADVFQSDGTFYLLYHAYQQADGDAELRIVELPFDEDGWPVGGPP